MLTKIATKDVEPFGTLELALAPRLNVLCGDNGTGKSFVLDLAWFALTGEWRRHAAIPRRGEGVTPRIDVEHLPHAKDTGTYDFAALNWSVLHDRKNTPVLALFLGADSSVDVVDPYRESGPGLGELEMHRWGSSHRFTFSPLQLWNGVQARDGTPLANGLIRDWVLWQYRPDRPERFDALKRTLAELSRGLDETLTPSAPTRIVRDAREIPTLALSTGDVPVTHASEGVRRILALAYALVWTWFEHVNAAKLHNTRPLDTIHLLIDEIDAHLHPRWQRMILPAVISAVKAIEPSVGVQILTTTHAPLVLASLETTFDEARDRLFHLRLEGAQLVVEAMPWTKRGDVDRWLMSDAFGLHQARSIDGEAAIEAAKAFLRGEATAAPLDTREAIDTALRHALPDLDPFWPRWLVKTGAVK